MKPTKSGNVRGGGRRSPTVDARVPPPSARSDVPFRVLFETSPLPMCIYDFNTLRYLAVNEAAVLHYGYSRAEFLSMRISDIRPAEDVPALLATVRKQSPGLQTTGEWRHRRRDGQIITVSVFTHVLRWAGRKAVIALMQDITDQKRAEAAVRESERRYRGLFDGIPIGLYRRGRDGAFVDVNLALVSILGYSSREALLAAEPGDLYVDAQKFREANELAADRVLDFETQLRRRDGTMVWVLETIRGVADAAGLVTVYEGAIRDITRRRKMEEAVRQAHAELQASAAVLERERHEISFLAGMSDLLLACATVDEAYVAAARSLAELLPGTSGALCVTSASRDSVEATSVWGAAPPGDSVFAPNDCWALRQGRIHSAGPTGVALVCRHLAAVSSDTCLCVPLAAHGETLGVLVLRVPDTSADPIAVQRLAGAAAQRIAPAIANLRLRDSLRAQSIRDPLTGLFNRRYLEETLDRELRRAQRRGVPVGIIMLDLDRFKAFNDTFGHEAGDTVLREFGAFLRARVRAEDIPCRYGGEEFVLILPEFDGTAVFERAQELREGVKHLSVLHGGRVLGPLSVSAGVVVFPEHGSTMAASLRAVDAALYRAKAEGRDRVVVAG